jgi:signal transduction histidine kinase
MPVKIGTRITITTAAMVVVTLGLYGIFSVRQRRSELVGELERQTELIGSAVQVAFEAALQDGLFEDTSGLIRRWQDTEPAIGLTYIDLAHTQPGQPPPAFIVEPSEERHDGGTAYVPPPPDGTRAGRLNRMSVDDVAVGEHINVGGHPVYALAVPIHGSEKKIIAAIELVRDESAVADELSESARAAIYAVAGLGVVLALLVYLSARSSISNPLSRLVEAIDDVTRGDLGRVILRERDDEVGDLAERFNEMTHSLREARDQILDGVDGKLALEARLRHSEKLATIGQLAAGIAHEVGTPLNVIGGRARNMEKKAGEALRAVPAEGEAPPSLDPEAVAKNAAIIAAQTQRITKIIQQLLDFARRPASVRTRVDLDAVAKGCLDFLEHQLATARIEARALPFAVEAEGPSTPVVLGDADQLQQVCLNLCVNAQQAMPDGGVLELATRGISRRKPGLETAAPGHYVVLEVADTGVGIPEENRDRIFEPFYSTKSGDSGGTGLGLAVSVGIVKEHDGWIEIDSLVGSGTVFRVYLPAAE